MGCIEENILYMRHLFLDSFSQELPIQERFIKATTFLILSLFYSIIGGTGLMFLVYGVSVVWSMING